jgi:hypothetical protein
VLLALATGAGAHAQSMEAQVPAGMQDPSVQGSVASAPGTRGIFLATIAALVAQGIGNGLSEGIGGSITRWFTGEPSPRDAAAVQSVEASRMATEQDPRAGLQPASLSRFI